MELWSVLHELNLENKAIVEKLDLKLSKKIDELGKSLVVCKYDAFVLLGIVIALVLKYFGFWI